MVARVTITEFLLARIAEEEAVARSVQEVSAKSSSDVFTSLKHPTGTVEMSPRRVVALIGQSGLVFVRFGRPPRMMSPLACRRTDLWLAERRPS